MTERRTLPAAAWGTPTREFWYDRPVVYRCYDSDGRLIYIGQTIDPAGRLMQHAQYTWWYQLVAKVRVCLYPTRIAALAAEKAAIKAEDPVFNVTHTTRKARWDSWHWTDADRTVHRAWQDRCRRSSAS